MLRFSSDLGVGVGAAMISVHMCHVLLVEKEKDRRHSTVRVAIASKLTVSNTKN